MANPQVIGPVVDWLLNVLQNMTAEQYGDLQPFAEFKQMWTGVAMNWPPVCVLPHSSQFDPEIEGAKHAENRLTVRFGVNGADPNEVGKLAVAYMLAVDAAIYQADAATPCVIAAAQYVTTRLFVTDHDYGPLFVKEGSFAYWPELHLAIETMEPLAQGANG